MNTKSLEGINWTFILSGTIATVNLLVAAADFLQGGVMWPCLLPVIWVQVLALWWCGDAQLSPKGRRSALRRDLT